MEITLTDFVAHIREKIEQKRIQIHLKKVEEDLRQGSVSEERSKTLDDLREYRRRGVFPENPDFLSREPFFVGPEGTLCAVGYLLDEGGKPELVEKISEERNNVYLEDVEDSEITDSINDLGLKMEEAERIQPGYSTTTHATLATTCGPVPCGPALAVISLLGSGAFLAMEYTAYKYIQTLYPEKPLKKTGSFLGLSVMNGVSAAALILITYALLP